MGIKIERSLKRLSHRMNDLVHKKSKAVENITHHTERIPNIDNSKPVLKRGNALNNEGVRTLIAITKKLEIHVADEEGTNTVDVFTNGSVPPVSLFDYFGRMARYVNIWCSYAGGSESSGIRAAVMTMMYFDKLYEKGFVVNRENVHRLAMVGFLVATKFTEDCPLSNAFWAKVGGVPAAEVNKLERAFSTLLKFEFFIHDEKYYNMLDAFHLSDL